MIRHVNCHLRKVVWLQQCARPDILVTYLPGLVQQDPAKGATLIWSESLCPSEHLRVAPFAGNILHTSFAAPAATDWAGPGV